MEPQTNLQPAAMKEEGHVLHQVTPVSKYLAMALFIILPFIGGWIGYTYAPEKVVEVENPVILKEDRENLHESNFNTVDVKPLRLSDLSRAEYLHTDYKLYTGETYKISSTSIRVLPFGSLYYTSPEFNGGFETYENLRIDEKILEVTDLPYLTVLASTSEVQILTEHCFAGKECRYSNLFKLDLKNRSVVEMSVGTFFNDVEFGSQISPDRKKVLTAIGYQGFGNATSSELYILDLFSDSALLLEAIPAEEKRYFCAPALGCDLFAKWLSANEIEVRIFNEASSSFESKVYSF